MESDEATPQVADLSLDPLQLEEQNILQGNPANEQEENGDHPEESGAKEKKRKKKKAKLQSHGGGLEPSAVLPSQNLVENYFPWITDIRPRRGRCAIAARAIKAGEVVIAEQALAFVPRAQDRTTVCHECCGVIGQNMTLVECSSCKHVVYCKKCEPTAIKNHSKWCNVSQQLKEIAKMSDCDEDLLRLVMALALKRPVCSDDAQKEAEEGDESKSEGTIKEGVLYPTFQDAMGLQTHIDKATAAWKESVRKCCSLLFSSCVLYSEGSDLPAGTGLQSSSVEELEMLAMLVNKNAHCMGAEGIHNRDVALGIFPFVSMLNHSCWPNCCFTLNGSVMTVRATEDIAKDSELCVSYVYLYEPRGVRKQNLADSKHVDCSCIRCSEPLIASVDRFLEGCVCSVEGCGGVQVKSSSLHGDNPEIVQGLSSWECDRCSWVTDPESPPPLSDKTSSVMDKPWKLVGEAESRLATAMGVYRERKFKDAQILLESFLADFTGKLHPLHVFLFDASTALLGCCRALGDAGEGARVRQILLNSLEIVVPGVSLEADICLGEMYSEGPQASSSSPAIAKRYCKQISLGPCIGDVLGQIAGESERPEAPRENVVSSVGFLNMVEREAEGLQLDALSSGLPADATRHEQPEPSLHHQLFSIEKGGLPEIALQTGASAQLASLQPLVGNPSLNEVGGVDDLGPAETNLSLSVSLPSDSLQFPGEAEDDPRESTGDSGNALLKENLEAGVHDTEARRAETLLSLEIRVRDLESQLLDRTEWAQRKVMQAAGRLTKDLAELKLLRSEREEAVRLKKDQKALEDSTTKKLSEMEIALRKATGQVDRANTAVRRLETENAEVRAEMEAAKLSAAESVATYQEVAKREKKGEKRAQGWEKQKAKLQEDLSEEKRKLSQLQHQLAQAKERQQQAEVRWRQEEKVKEEAVLRAENEKRLKEQAEAAFKRREESSRRKADQDKQRLRDDIKRFRDDIERLGQELTNVRVSMEGTHLPTSSWSSTLVTLGATGGRLNMKEMNDRLLRELAELQQDFSRREVRRDRECVMCMCEEMSVVFLPCAHQVVCTSCNELHEKQGMRDCPSCRTPIQKRIRVYGASF